MPVNNCSDNGKPGYKWGDGGKCYTYNPSSESSKVSAKKKALAQGIAIGDIVTDSIERSLTQWFRERWVDISRPKPGGGFEPCGRSDAGKGKYPKCVPASRAARMTQEEIDSAVRRKRRAESTQTRTDKKPIYVSTVNKATVNVPTNAKLYAQVKAEAKRLFDVYPSAYANAWLVREYKKRGGGYRTVSKSVSFEKVAEDLTEEEAGLADALARVANRYGKFDQEGSGIWVGYESAEENDDAEIGVNCKNCVLYEGEGVCKILSMQVEDYGKCRFAVIPDNLVQVVEQREEMEDEMEDDSEEEDDMEEESGNMGSDAMQVIVSLVREILNSRR